jgi:ribosomal protein S18 acetylase RimI-like enzyme
VGELLHNPVYNALMSGDKHLSQGSGSVKYFDDEVSPFAGFHQNYDLGFEDLYEQLPAGRKILYATPGLVKEPAGWQLLVEIKGLQFVFSGKKAEADNLVKIVVLRTEHIPEMMSLAGLTKPGPFGSRTIEFGHYHGVFVEGKLAAMTGQRLHVANYTEISAVCTHPDHLGKGFAAALIIHQLKLITESGQIPFLHVRADNERAIALYERLGFKVSREMNFYFMKRRDEAKRE